MRIVPSDTRLPLPAMVALDILLAANSLRDTLTWTPPALTLIRRFRALLAMCVNYTFLCRAETGTRCLKGDLTIDKASQHICLFVRKSKADQACDTRDKLVLAVPITANPMISDLLDYYYLAHRTAFCTTNYHRPPHAAIWSVSPFDPSAEWKAAAALSSWLALALRTINTTAPTGFKWTSQCLRKGAAPAASCIGASLPVIIYMGGWAKNNSVTQRKYNGPTMAC
jgi:hypothetical protein